MKVFKAVGVCLLLEAAAVGLFWLAADVAGTRRAAPFAAMLLLVALVVDWGTGRAKAR